MSEKRFAEKTKVEIKNLIKCKNSSSMKTATKQVVKLLRDFRIEKEVPAEFENLNRCFVLQVVLQQYVKR